MLGPAEILLIAVVVLITVGAVLGAVKLARARGRDPWRWALLTLLFLPAPLLLLVLPRAKPASA